jgi:Glycosyltransferase
LVRSYKGLELLLDALSDERFDCLPVKLIVAGEFYDEKKPCLDKIDRLNLNQRVILFDQYIPDDQVKNYFNVADIVVQPYRSATQSGVTQIAYHFDKPMLVTDVGGLRETVPNGKVGYVVKPEAQEIASALVDFFQHSRLREFEANAQNEKQKYSWSKMVEILLSLSKN